MKHIKFTSLMLWLLTGVLAGGYLFSSCNDWTSLEDVDNTTKESKEQSYEITDDFLTKENLSEDEIQFVAKIFTSNNLFSTSTNVTRSAQRLDVDNIFPLLIEGNQVLAYAVNFKGGGYNIVSATQKYAPIIGFSEEGSIESDYRERNPSLAFWLDFLKKDIIYQKNKTIETDTIAINNRMLWRKYEAAAVSTRDKALKNTTRSTIQNHQYWYMKERNRMMTGEITISNIANFMSEDLQRYNDIVNADYGGWISLSNSERENLRIINNTMKLNYKQVGISTISAYYWSEFFVGYTNYDTGEMVKTQWKQGFPYNILNPLKEAATDNFDKHQPVGCVTIAVSQILNYYKHPQNLRRKEGLLTFKTLTVDWNKTNIISLNDSTLLDIPQLIRFVNQGVFTQNGDNSSSSNLTKAKDFFELNQYTVTQYDGRYIDKMIEETKAGRPVYVRGENDTDGHAFICNGYKNIDTKVTIELTSTNSYTVKDYPTNPYFKYKSSQGKRTATGEYLNFNWGWGYATWLISPSNSPMDFNGFNNNIKILTIQKR